MSTKGTVVTDLETMTSLEALGSIHFRPAIKDAILIMSVLRLHLHLRRKNARDIVAAHIHMGAEEPVILNAMRRQVYIEYFV